MRKLLFLVFITFSFFVDGQDMDTTGVKPIILVYADVGEGIQTDTGFVQFVHGNVLFNQDSMYMYCDTARLVNNVLDAIGNVIIQQTDTLSVFADSLHYFGDSLLAYLIDDVVLQNFNYKLFSDELKYNVDSRVASYDSYSIMTNDTVFLSSKNGVFKIRENIVYFKDSVIIDGDDFYLKTDSMDYDLNNETAYYLGPTVIIQDSSTIYCEGGEYNTKSGDAIFYQNFQYQKDGTKAKADTVYYFEQSGEYILKGNAEFIDGKQIVLADEIRYNYRSNIYFLNGNASIDDGEQKVVGEHLIYYVDEKRFSTSGRATVLQDEILLSADNLNYDNETGKGYAIGNVLFQDSVNGMWIECVQLDMDRLGDTSLYVAHGERPIMHWGMNGDTTHISSDTIVGFKLDSSNTVYAYHDVRIFSKDMNGLCDSLIYDEYDSRIRLLQDPVIWMDSTQMSGEEIILILKEDSIDSLKIKENSFIISFIENGFYDQIKGKFINGKLDSNELKIVNVYGNAETIYHILDEEERLIGVNKARSSSLFILLKNQSVESITYLGDPEGNVFPGTSVISKPLKFKGFNWIFDKRPQSIEDLLIQDFKVKSQKILEDETKENSGIENHKNKKFDLNNKSLDK